MPNPYRTEIYKGGDLLWRWRRVVVANGRCVSSGEGYKRRATMTRLLRKMHPADRLVDLTAR